LLAGRNITMWAYRAVSQPGPAIAILAILIALAALGFRLALRQAPDEPPSRLPAIAALVIAALVLVGFLRTSPIRTSPDRRAALLVSAGLQAQQAGYPVKAQELYAIVLGLDAGNQGALQNLALLYEKSGKTTETTSLRSRVEGWYCPDPQSCYEAGRRFLAERALDAAINVWEEASQRFPTEPSLIRDVAWGRYQLEDFAAAIIDYTRASELSPGDNSIRTDLAWSLLRAGQPDQARSICNQVLSKDAQNTSAIAILAQLAQRR